MIPYSLGMAATVRVGQTLGAGQPRAARFAAGVAMASALAYACLSASSMLWLRESIAALYTHDAAVISLAASLMVYALFRFRCHPGHCSRLPAAIQVPRQAMPALPCSPTGISTLVSYSLWNNHWVCCPSRPAQSLAGLMVETDLCHTCVLSIPSFPLAADGSNPDANPGLTECSASADTHPTSILGPHQFLGDHYLWVSLASHMPAAETDSLTAV